MQTEAVGDGRHMEAPMVIHNEAGVESLVAAFYRLCVSDVQRDPGAGVVRVAPDGERLIAASRLTDPFTFVGLNDR